MNDRVRCINPKCGRTFKREPGQPDSYSVCCGKCWRLLPAKLTRRYKALRVRDRRIGRLAKRKRTGIFNTAHQLAVMGGQIDRLHDANWQAICAFFRPVDKPQGLDAFLEEMNL
jgi:hypothetical protein